RPPAADRGRARPVRGRRGRRCHRRGRAAQQPRHRAADPDAEGAAPATRSGRQGQIAVAPGLFGGDAADDVIAEAALRSNRGIERPIQMPKAPHRIRVAAGTMLALYGLLTLGARATAALGVGVAEPPKHAHNRVYLGVRLTAEELASPRIR